MPPAEAPTLVAVPPLRAPAVTAPVAPFPFAPPFAGTQFEPFSETHPVAPAFPAAFVPSAVLAPPLEPVGFVVFGVAPLASVALVRAVCAPIVAPVAAPVLGAPLLPFAGVQPEVFNVAQAFAFVWFELTPARAMPLEPLGFVVFGVAPVATVAFVRAA
jgi:hypothetical protein